MSPADPEKPDGNLPAFKPREPLALSMPQREAVIERLTQSFAEDAITMDEFERRAEMAYRAVTMADLQTLVADLPSPPEPAASPSGKAGKKVARGGVRDRINTMWSSTQRGIPGILPRFLRIRTIMGNTELDFRQSTFEPGITEVNVRCLMGNVELTVPDGVHVEVFCSSLLGNVGMTDTSEQSVGDVTFDGTGAGHIAPDNAWDEKVANALQRMPPVIRPGQRVLRITGRVILGNVEVHRGSLRREP